MQPLTKLSCPPPWLASRNAARVVHGVLCICDAAPQAGATGASGAPCGGRRCCCSRTPSVPGDMLYEGKLCDDEQHAQLQHRFKAVFMAGKTRQPAPFSAAILLFLPPPSPLHIMLLL